MRSNLSSLSATLVGIFVASCHSSTTPAEAIVGGCGVVNETGTFQPLVVWTLPREEQRVDVLPP